MRNSRAAAFLTGFLACSLSYSRAQQHPNQEQRAFGAEDESFKNPFALPRSILDILSRDDIVKDSLEDENIQPDKLPASWFQASEVHLAGPAERDVVVMGICPVCGANVAPFWVFRPTALGYEQIMFGVGLGLEVLRHRANGYLDLQTGSVVQQKPWTGLWRFDGQKYQLAADKKGQANGSE